VPVAPSCNPNYLGGWDQEDQGLRSAQENNIPDPISKITRAKWTGGMSQAFASVKPWLSSTPVPLKNKTKQSDLFNEEIHQIFLCHRKGQTHKEQPPFQACPWPLSTMPWMFPPPPHLILLSLCFRLLLFILLELSSAFKSLHICWAPHLLGSWSWRCNKNEKMDTCLATVYILLWAEGSKQLGCLVP
jgi:hypothetical protein